MFFLQITTFGPMLNFGSLRHCPSPQDSLTDSFTNSAIRYNIYTIFIALKVAKNINHNQTKLKITHTVDTFKLPLY